MGVVVVISELPQPNLALLLMNWSLHSSLLERPALQEPSAHVSSSAVSLPVPFGFVDFLGKKMVIFLL